jgi:hypothetical protein
MHLHRKHLRIIRVLQNSSGTTAGVIGNELRSFQDRNLRDPLEELFGCGYVAFRSGQGPWRTHQEVAALPKDLRHELYYRLTSAARLAMQS